MNGPHFMTPYDAVGIFNQLRPMQAKIDEISAMLTLGSVPEPDDSKKIEDLLSKVRDTLEGWKKLEAQLGQGQHKAICNDHIAFLEDFKKRCTSETHDVLSSEFDNYKRYVGSAPTGTRPGEPWKAVELVKMGEKEVNVLQLVAKKAAMIATARIVAPHSDPESGYWVHYPSKTIGGVAVRPIHLLGKEKGAEALYALVFALESLKDVPDERTTERGMVGAFDGGPVGLVENPAQPDTVTSLGPCSVDEFFEKLGYLSIEEDKGNQGRRVLAIADTKWDERLYPSFKRIFKDPLPVVFTHGNLVPENVLCTADGSICEITGWEHAGWLPQGWEGAAALRGRGLTNASWHGMGTLAISVLDGSFSLGRKEPIRNLWKLENARLDGRLAPPSWWDHAASRTRHCKDQTQSMRRIREFPEKGRAQSGGEGLIASDGEVPTV